VGLSPRWRKRKASTTANALGSIWQETVVVALVGSQAVLSLDEHGQQKTWPLTDWEEGKPDDTGEVRTQFGAAQRIPTFGRDALVVGLRNTVRHDDGAVLIDLAPP